MSKKITFSLEISDEDYEALVKKAIVVLNTNHYRDETKAIPMDVFLRQQLWRNRKGLLNTLQISNYDVVIE